MNLSARLDKLERTDSNGCVFIWQNNRRGRRGRFDRWRATHPGQP